MDQLTQALWMSRVVDNSSHGPAVDEELSRFSRPLRNFAATVAILIMIIGLLGNLLTIVALLKYPKVRNVAAAFIISLCVADFIFCLLVLPFDSIRFIDASWADVRFLCVLVPFLRYGNVGVSLLSVGAITINRYIMIAHHGIYGRVYKKHWIALMIVFCWLFSYGMQVPTLVGSWGKFDYDANLETCSIIRDANGRTSKTFLFVTGFVIPCIVIVGCYTKIFWVVHKSESRLRKHTAPPSIKSPHSPGRDIREIKQRRSEWRITKMVLAIFLGFVACYLPITIVKVADPEVTHPALHVLGYLLLYFASCVNPIIYVIMNKQYRQAYAGVISCSRIRASLTPHGSSAPGQNNFGHQGNDQRSSGPPDPRKPQESRKAEPLLGPSGRVEGRAPAAARPLPRPGPRAEPKSRLASACEPGLQGSWRPRPPPTPTTTPTPPPPPGSSFEAGLSSHCD